jgi:hypothetical protein
MTTEQFAHNLTDKFNEQLTFLNRAKTNRKEAQISALG